MGAPLPLTSDNAIGPLRAPQVSSRRPLARPSATRRALSRRQPTNSRQQEPQDKQHQEEQPKTRPTTKTNQDTTTRPMTTKQNQEPTNQANKQIPQPGWHPDASRVPASRNRLFAGSTHGHGANAFRVGLFGAIRSCGASIHCYSSQAVGDSGSNCRQESSREWVALEYLHVVPHHVFRGREDRSGTRTQLPSVQFVDGSTSRSNRRE